jgi:uncharacterized protein YqgC (DUF456 family)
MRISKIIIKRAFGAILILLGLFALFTPMTPGAWLIFIGLELVGLKFLLNHRLVIWLKKLIGKEREMK